MIRIANLCSFFVIFLLLQVSVFPRYFDEPFKPDLIIIIAVYLGLQESFRWGWCFTFLAGLVQDCYSGLYLGLHGFIYLAIYLFLKVMADFLYAESRYLLVVVVFLATFVDGLLQLFLLALYSTADGLYAAILPALFPQALVNTLCASLIAGMLPLAPVEEKR
jgi:rod shape-determining protein MreD